MRLHVAVCRLYKGRRRRRRRRGLLHRLPHSISHAHLPAFENVINTNWNGSSLFAEVSLAEIYSSDTNLYLDNQTYTFEHSLSFYEANREGNYESINIETAWHDFKEYLSLNRFSINDIYKFYMK